MQIISVSQYEQKINLRIFGEKIDLIERPHRLLSIFKQSFSQQLQDFKLLKKTSTELRNYYSLLIYHKVLHKIIDLVAEKKHALKNLESSSSDTEILSLFELNSYYDKYFKKYSKIPSGISWKVWIRNSSLFFFHSYHFLEPCGIQQKKELADKGYSMISELERWLDKSLLNEDISFEDLVLNLAKEFLEWADAHPKAASHLISDVALTCSVLLEKNVSERLFIALDAMIVTRLFFDSLGLCQEYEKIEDDDLLKFRALADFMTYCPKIATIYNIIKKTARGDSHTLSSWLGTAIQETAGTAVSQKIAHLVPKGKERFVSFLIDTIRGKDVREILAHQRNLALIQVAGTIRKVMKSPHPFLLSLEVWWKTIFEATGKERKARVVTQILIPVAGVSLFTATFFMKFQENFIIGLTKRITSLAVSSLMIALSFGLTHLIDEKTKFKSKKQVEQEIEKRETELKRGRINHYLLTNANMREHLTKESQTYIHDLQKRNALPIVVSAEHLSKLEGKNKTFFHKIKVKYLEKLKSYESEKILNASEAVAIFNQILNLKDLRMKLEGFDAKTCDTIIFSLVDELTKEWLQKAVEKAFKDQLIESCQLSSEDLKNKIENGNQYPSLENYFKTEAKSLSDPYQKDLYKRVINQIDNEKQHSFFSI